MALQKYPPVSFYFKVEIDGFPDDIGFQSVEGLSVKFDEDTHAEGGENTFTHHFPKRASYGDLTLKRGTLIGSAMIAWFNDAVQNFNFDPRDVTVTLQTAEGTPLDQWLFRNAWPKSWNIDSLDSTNNKISAETIALTYQYFNRVGMPARDQSAADI